MTDNSGIEIIFSSDSDYENLVVELRYDGKFIALLNQDEGIDKLKIEFPGTVALEEMVLRKVDLKVFETALKMAKKELMEG